MEVIIQGLSLVIAFGVLAMLSVRPNGDQR